VEDIAEQLDVGETNSASSPRRPMEHVVGVAGKLT
jgi:hypothetical protein